MAETKNMELGSVVNIFRGMGKQKAMKNKLHGERYEANVNKEFTDDTPHTFPLKRKM